MLLLYNSVIMSDSDLKCELCNARFKRKENLVEHKKRKRSCVNFSHNFVCDKCDKPYSSRSGYKYHKSVCNHIKTPTNEEILIKQNETMIKMMTTGFDDIKKENAELRNKINNIEKGNIVTNINNGSINTINNNLKIQHVTLTKQYIKNNFLDEPILLPIPNYDSIIGYSLSKKELDFITIKTDKDKEKFIMDLLCINKNNKLVEFLGSYLTLYYKMDAVSLRALWTVDNSRHTFIVKILSGEIFWRDDGQGEYVIKTIIEPLITYLLTIVHNYTTTIVIPKNLDLCRKCNELCRILPNKDLKENILKFMSPKFTIDKVTRYDPITFKPLQICN